MGRNNKVRKFAAMKRMIKAKDNRLKGTDKKKQLPQKKKKEDGKIIERHLPKVSTALFFKYNEQLGNFVYPSVYLNIKY